MYTYLDSDYYMLDDSKTDRFCYMPLRILKEDGGSGASIFDDGRIQVYESDSDHKIQSGVCSELDDGNYITYFKNSEEKVYFQSFFVIQPTCQYL